jgi:histidine triad (HIT) family protein
VHECVFCSIQAGELPAHFVYEDDLIAGFLSLEQPNPYKVLVVPREHVETVCDLNDELASAIFQTTAKIARRVRDVSKCDGMNLMQPNGKASLQDVFHFHFHIVPRFFEDGIILDWDNTPAQQEKLSQYAQEMRTQLEVEICPLFI